MHVCEQHPVVEYNSPLYHKLSTNFLFSKLQLTVINSQDVHRYPSFAQLIYKFRMLISFVKKNVLLLPFKKNVANINMYK